MNVMVSNWKYYYERKIDIIYTFDKACNREVYISEFQNKYYITTVDSHFVVYEDNLLLSSDLMSKLMYDIFGLISEIIKTEPSKLIGYTSLKSKWANG